MTNLITSKVPNTDGMPLAAPSPISMLPNELLLQIFGYFRWEEVGATLSKVNNQWYQLSKDPLLWATFWKDYWKARYETEGASPQRPFPNQVNSYETFRQAGTVSVEHLCARIDYFFRLESGKDIYKIFSVSFPTYPDAHFELEIRRVKRGKPSPAPSQEFSIFLGRVPLNTPLQGRWHVQRHSKTTEVEWDLRLPFTDEVYNKVEGVILREMVNLPK